jgi:putative flippase GtrA
MAGAIADLYGRIRHLVPELAKFGVVGGIGTVVDLGGAAVLHSVYRVGPLEAKAISITAATAVTYAGSRFWTFRHRENQPVHREAVLFIALNAVGLVIAEAVIGLTTYVIGLRGPVAYNAASLLGTGLGTIFRFYAYRRWVFLDPAGEPAKSPAGAEGEDVPDFPPWELDPAFFDRSAGHSVPLDDSFIPNERVASPLVAAAAPVWEALAREALAREALAREALAREALAREALARQAPAREAPPWEALAQQAPAQEALARQAPAQEAPAREALARQAPPWEAPPWEASESATAPMPSAATTPMPMPVAPAATMPMPAPAPAATMPMPAPSPAPAPARPPAPAGPRAPGRHRKTAR